MQLARCRSTSFGKRTCREVALPVDSQSVVVPWNKQLGSSTYARHFRDMSSTHGELYVGSD
jgi:hypothetical protein